MPIPLSLAAKVAALSADFSPEDFSQRQRVTEQRLLILGDAHIPYHDPQLLTQALLDAPLHGVEAIVWLGDLMDMPTFSSWGRDDYATRFERELSAVRQVIELAATIPGITRQYWSSGNHEMRLMRKVEYQFGMEHLALMAGLGALLADGRLVVSDNPTLDYSSPARDGRAASTWMLTHPAKYGSSPLVVPGRVADRYQANVISAHAHHWAMGKSPSNRFTVVESGGLFKPENIKYVQHRITDHRAWTQGYVLLLDGHPALFAPRAA